MLGHKLARLYFNTNLVERRSSLWAVEYPFMNSAQFYKYEYRRGQKKMLLLKRMDEPENFTGINCFLH